MLEYISQLAGILGVGLQGYEFIDKIIKNKEVSSAVKLLYIMQTPTQAWKEIHLQYCVLRVSTDKIYSATHTSNGNAKKSVSASELQKVFQDPILYKAVSNLRKDLVVSVNNIGLSFVGADIDKSIQRVDNEKIRFALEKIHDSQKRALEVHEHVCNFFGRVEEFIDNPKWDDSNAGYILGARKIYKMECSSMIDYTDMIIMKLLDIYEVAFSALHS